ncbi:MAG: ABC transporter substrate-binding protein [Chloroflexota bacterium]
MWYRKPGVLMVGLMIVGLLLSACATPTPEVIEKVVTQVIKETVKETVIVEGTPQVVEKEVTRVIVATAEPTPASMAGVCECGGDVIIGSNGDGKIVNPILAIDTDGFWRTDLMFDSLVRVDPETTAPVGQLAESWDISDDATTYTFHLVDADVRWHDGEPFTVADIEFTMMEILKSTYTGIFQTRFADLVGADKVIAGEATELEGFQVIDDKTVQFKLNQPNASFLAYAIRDLKFLPKHLLEGQEITEDMPYSLAPVGNGPYKFKEWDKGNRFVMEWNEDYWGGRPCVKTLTTVVIPDMQALAAAVEAGDIDMTIMVPPTEVARLAQVDGLAYYKQPSVGAEVLWFNPNHPILGDVRVRRAIAHAIDVQAFTEGVLQGTTDPANSQLTTASWAYNPNATLPEYNPEKAKELLAEAGYADGFKIKLSTNQGNFFREHFVEYVQAELAKVGIEVEVVKAEWGTFIGAVMAGDFEMRFHNQTGGIPDPDVIVEVFHTDGANNYGKYSNPEVDRLLEEAGLSTNLEERKQMYYQVQDLLNEDLIGFPAFWRPNPLVANARYGNVVPSVLHTYGGVHNWCVK